MDLNLFNVEDPDQWENADMAEIDLALRCNVCKEFLDPAMILPCSHNFCSLCIRRCLAADPSCPACRAPARESNLNKNVALDNIVRHFRNVRSHLLSLVTADNNAKQLPQPIPEPTTDSPSERVPETTKFPRAAKSRRKPPDSKMSENCTLNRPIIAINSETEDREDHNYKDNSGSIPRRSTRSKTSNELQPESKDEAPVQCPICGRAYPLLILNKHLDCCLEGKPDEEELLWVAPSTVDATLGTTQPTSLVKTSRFHDLGGARNPTDESLMVPARAPKKIRRPYYHLLKLKDLRKILAEHCLPNDDDAASMERRHREFVNLWNANCDSSQPKDPQTIVREVEIWERTRNREARDRGKAAFLNANGSIGEATLGSAAFGAADIQKHSIQYKTQFDELLRKARATAPKPVATTQSTGKQRCSLSKFPTTRPVSFLNTVETKASNVTATMATTFTLAHMESLISDGFDTTAVTTICTETMTPDTTPTFAVTTSFSESSISVESSTTPATMTCADSMMSTGPDTTAVRPICTESMTSLTTPTFAVTTTFAESSISVGSDTTSATTICGNPFNFAGPDTTAICTDPMIDTTPTFTTCAESLLSVGSDTTPGSAAATDFVMSAVPDIAEVSSICTESVQCPTAVTSTCTKPVISIACDTTLTTTTADTTPNIAVTMPNFNKEISMSITPPTTATCSSSPNSVAFNTTTMSVGILPSEQDSLLESLVVGETMREEEGRKRRRGEEVDWKHERKVEEGDEGKGKRTKAGFFRMT